MNEKFFALPREKQDRILNAALRAFGEYGYKRAITDDIAAAAGISKGLLFHYFHNKAELFRYAHEHSIRFIKEKMALYHVAQERDFFRLMVLSHRAKLEIMHTYPYIFDFLLILYLRRDPEAAQIMDVLNADFVAAQKTGLLCLIDKSKFKEGVSPEQVMDIVLWSAQGFMDMEFRTKDQDFEKVSEKYLACLEMMRQQFYREEYL